MRASDVMTTKVISATPETSVAELARMMLDNRISGVPVLENGRLVGMVSEGDLVRQLETPPRYTGWLSLFMSAHSVADEYVHQHGRKARDVMTTEVVTASADTPVAELAETMEWRRIKRVPVIGAEGAVLGIITRANLLRALASRNAATVPQDDDLAIRDALVAELATQPWAGRPQPENIIVEDGVVHLWGAYDDPAVRRALVVAAEGIPGVRKVVDHLDRSLEPDVMNRPNWPSPGRP